MKISTKGRYALVIMAYLANLKNKDRYVSLKEISENENISYKYLEKIMISLNKSNFLDVARGTSGGYKLKLLPEEYKIGDILRSVEGELAPVYCVTRDICPKKNECSSYPFWEGLYNEINNYVDNKTLADLIKEVK